MSRWDLTDEIRNGIGVKIKDWLDNVETNFHVLQEVKDKEELDLTDCEINPYQLETFIEELGFEQIDYYNNGWQMDYWNYFKRNNFYVSIEGTGILHELKLVVCFDEEE